MMFLCGGFRAKQLERQHAEQKGVWQKQVQSTLTDMIRRISYLGKRNLELQEQDRIMDEELIANHHLVHELRSAGQERAYALKSESLKQIATYQVLVAANWLT
jgi:hypothetical protein